MSKQSPEEAAKSLEVRKRAGLPGVMHQLARTNKLEGAPSGPVVVQLACAVCCRGVKLDQQQLDRCVKSRRFPRCLPCVHHNREQPLPPKVCGSLLASLASIGGVSGEEFASKVVEEHGGPWPFMPKRNVPEKSRNFVRTVLRDRLPVDLGEDIDETIPLFPPPPPKPIVAPVCNGVRLVRLEEVRIDGDTQPRDGIDESIVSEYAERMRAGDAFPPLEVIHDGRHYWLWDGFHHLHATRKADQAEARVNVIVGTVDDARWRSLAANKKHGLKRSGKDKRRAVELALKRRPNESDSAIAAHVGVDHKTVAAVRLDLGIPKSATRTGKDGRTIDTTKIGKKPKAKSGFVEAVPKKSPVTIPAVPFGGFAPMEEDGEMEDDGREPYTGNLIATEDEEAHEDEPAFVAGLDRVIDAEESRPVRVEVLKVEAVREPAKPINADVFDFSREGNEIQRWLVERRESWPENQRPAFERFISRALEEIRVGDEVGEE